MQANASTVHLPTRGQMINMKEWHIHTCFYPISYYLVPVQVQLDKGILPSLSTNQITRLQVFDNSIGKGVFINMRKRKMLLLEQRGRYYITFSMLVAMTYLEYSSK